MRFLIGSFVVIAGLAGGAWYLGAKGQERALATWLTERQADGWTAETRALGVSGFPMRFETSAEGITLADPEYGWSLEMPSLQFSQAAYQPNDITVVFPERAEITTPSDQITVTAGKAEGGVHFAANTALALKSSAFVLEDLALTGARGWTSAMERAVFKTTPAEGTDFGHDVAFNAVEMRLAEGLRQKLDPKGKLPKTFETLSLDATFDFDRPWDRDAVEGVKPRFTAIDLDGLKAAWGPMALEALGSVTVDPSGVPTGTVSIRAKDWKNMLSLAVESGALAAEMRGTVEGGLSLISALSGNKETLDVKLRFEDGLTLLGPIPLGPAPRLIIQ